MARDRAADPLTGVDRDALVRAWERDALAGGALVQLAPRTLSTPADEGFAAERDRARAEWQRTHATTLNVLGVFADARPVSAQAYVTADQRDATVRQLIARWATDEFYTLRATAPLVAVYDADADGGPRREWREVAGEWRALELPTGGAR